MRWHHPLPLRLREQQSDLCESSVPSRLLPPLPPLPLYSPDDVAPELCSTMFRAYLTDQARFQVGFK